MRKYRNKGKHTEQNNNSLVTKQSQGSLFPPQGLQYSEPRPVSCLIDTETPTKWKNLTTRSPDCSCGEGNGTPPQYSCLENPMDRGAWWAAVHGVTKSRTRLRDFTFTFHLHALEKEMATHSSVLAWRTQGLGSLVGCHLWGRTESDTIEAT